MNNNPEEDSDSFREALAVLGSQKTFIILFCMSAILTALALTYIASDKYESATTISYRPNTITLLKAKESQSFGAPSPVPPFEVISQNLKELIKSESILREVVLDLGLDQKIKPNDDPPWYVYLYRVTKEFGLDLADKTWMILKYGRIIEGDPIVAATKNLRKNVFLVDKGSYIFYIVVRDKYPRRAPLIVDAIASKLEAWMADKQKSPGGARQKQFKKILEGKAAEIENYQIQIEEILSNNRIASSSLEAKNTTDQLSELELTRINLEGEIKRANARLVDAEKYYATKRAGAKGASDGNGNRLFIQPEDYKKLASEKLFIGIELSGLMAKYNSVKASISELERKKKKLPDIQHRLERFQTQLEIAKRDYVQIADAYQEAQVEATASVGEIEVLHDATIPSHPVSPIKIYNVGMAAFLSLFISIALVYVLTYANIHFLFPPNPMPKSLAANTSGESITKSIDQHVNTNPWLGPERRNGGDRRVATAPWPGPERREGGDRRHNGYDTY